MEPFGPLREDFRAGQIAATLANVHRSPDAEPYRVGDFFETLVRLEDATKDAPILLPDAEAQARLIKATLFGET